MMVYDTHMSHRSPVARLWNFGFKRNVCLEIRYRPAM